MISLRYRDALPTTVADELDSFIAQLKAVFLVSHDESGNQITTDQTLTQVKVGVIEAYGGATAPTGYLLCDGSQVSRVTYKGLFDVIQTGWGAGDGSTTFNLPDLRQRFLLGKAASGTGNTLGASGGAIDHTHTGGSHTHAAGTLAVDSHTHAAGTLAGPSHTHTGPSHTHGVGTLEVGDPDDTVDINDGGGILWGLATQSHVHPITGSTASGGTGTTGASGTGSVTGSTAGATATISGSTASSSGTTGTNNPPFAVVNYIIFTGRA